MPWSRLQEDSFSQGGTSDSVIGLTDQGATAGSKLIAVTECTRSGGPSTCLSVITRPVGGATTGTFTRIVVASANNGGGTTSELAVWACDMPAAHVGTKWPAWEIVANYTPAVGGSGQAIVCQEVTGLAATIDGTPGTLSGFATPIGPPAYTSHATGSYLIYAYADWGSNANVAAPAGYASDGKTGNNSGIVLCAYKDSTGGTETGTFSSQPTNTPRNVAMIAFPLAGSDPDPEPEPPPPGDDTPETSTGVPMEQIPGTAIWHDPHPMLPYQPNIFDPISV